jgi:D-glycero-beta-D-manno-heptose-7-phosphate kinase
MVTERKAPDLGRLADLVDLFPRQTILALCDFVADEFVFGEISRVSREAPVLILRHRETRLVPGGGANAVNNLADLGAKVLPVAAIGDDEAGSALLTYFRAKGVPTSGLVRVSGWQTPAKTRFLAGWPHTTHQQVLRMDREPGPSLPEQAAKAVVQKARQHLKGASAVLVSDYGYGSATPAALQSVRGRGRWLAPVALDSRYRLREYAGLGLTAATPNEAEVEAAYHEHVATDAERLHHLARQMMSSMGLGALVVTRGRDGMMVFERDKTPESLAIFGSDQALDVTGAGDTVIAVLTLALAAGATVLEAAQLANYAGGIVVMKRGTATVTRAELSATIRAEATGSAVAGSA